MQMAAITDGDDPINFAKDYEARFGRVILAYDRPSIFLTNHGYMTASSLAQDIDKMYRRRELNPIAIVAHVAQTFMDSDREAQCTADQKLAEDRKDILFWRMFGEDAGELLEEVRRSRWQRESTSRLYARLGAYSDEDNTLFWEDISAIKSELARRGVTEAAWGRRAPQLSLN